MMISAKEALERLKQGNQRYISGSFRTGKLFTSEKRSLSAKKGQTPFAVILACSDSRVPVEVIFDQGIGDLFVIRVAGNVAGPSQIASIEFAISSWQTPLFLVMGHSMCGAVTAVLNSLKEAKAKERLSSPNMPSILSQIELAISTMRKSLKKNENYKEERASLIKKAVRANVESSMREASRHSEILQKAVDKGKLLILGAEYSLEKGLVEFYE